VMLYVGSLVCVCKCNQAESFMTSSFCCRRIDVCASHRANTLLVGWLVSIANICSKDLAFVNSPIILPYPLNSCSPRCVFLSFFTI